MSSVFMYGFFSFLFLAGGTSACGDEHDMTLLQLHTDIRNIVEDKQFLEVVRPTNSSQPLRWSTLRRFPPRGRDMDSHCATIGRQFPPIVSRNQSVLDAYRKYACRTALHYFVTDPDLALTAQVAALQNGCINLGAEPKTVVATNGTHRYDAHRHCTGSCLDDLSRQQLSVKMINENVLVLTSIRTLPGMVYQHALTDVLPSAWSVLKLLKKSDMKLVLTSSIHVQLLRSIGLESSQLLEIPLRTLDEQTLLCVSPGRTLTVWRTGSDDGSALPTLDYSDRRKYADYWWRLPAYQLGPEVSDAIARIAGFHEDAPQGVLFLPRCTERRLLANEQNALAAVSSVLVASQRDFELSTFCAGREDFLSQVRKIRKARLIIGEHGGAMANMLLSRNGTGIIELVGSAEAHIGLPGEFPPYKSMWYGGAGAAFPFYRVVVYEPSQHGLVARLEDLQEAVQQWLAA
eukprot:s321_g36.t1